MHNLGTVDDFRLNAQTALPPRPYADNVPYNVHLCPVGRHQRVKLVAAACYVRPLLGLDFSVPGKPGFFFSKV
jgi:hypothetical protein